MKQVLLIVVLFTTACNSLPAENVLFIGNSFTFGGSVQEVRQHGGVPQLVETIALSKGKNISTGMLTSSGKGWSYHLANPATTTALKSEAWTDVVLQDFSLNPTRLGNLDTFLKNGEALYARIDQEAPDAKLILFETWARGPGHKLYSPGAENKGFHNPEEMYQEVHAGYMQLAKLLEAKEPGQQVFFAPVGTAFERCLKEYPQLKLYDRDIYHASPLGSYLAALVLYATIFQDSPVGATRDMPAYQVTDADAKILQAVAREVTQDK